MDILVLKSFIPEIFLSLIILAQLLFNTHITNNLNFNFPTINKELFIQTFFILFCLFLLLLNLKIEGFFTNFLLCNEEGGRSIKLLFILCSLFVLTYVVKSFSVQKLNFFEFFSIFLFSILSLLLLVSTHDLLSSYLALEMQALCFYILASFKRNSAFSTEAGLKYFVSGSFISCIFLLGASLIYGSLGTLNFNSLNQLLSFKFEQELDYLTYFIVFGSSCIISTLLFKISAAPFHFWSPDVYEGAPLSSTTIFSVLPKVVLFSFLINWINTISTLSCFSSNILIFSGVLSVCIGTFFALRQKRMKRFIIYSSIAQVGFPVIAMSFPFLNSFISIYFFLIVYTLTSILVWGHYTLAYTCQQKLNSFLKQDSSLLFISSFSNLFYTNKIWSLSFLIIFFSVAGIPPLSGFLAKIFILFNLIELQELLLSVILVLLSALSTFYYIRILKIMFFEPAVNQQLNNKNLQLILNNSNFDYLIFSFLLSLLLIFFFYPTFPLLFSQYVILNIT